MRLIHCTQNLLKELDVPLVGPDKIPLPTEGLGNWYANLLRIDRTWFNVGFRWGVEALIRPKPLTDRQQLFAIMKILMYNQIVKVAEGIFESHPLRQNFIKIKKKLDSASSAE
jgi:hypothetical protein